MAESSSSSKRKAATTTISTRQTVRVVSDQSYNYSHQNHAPKMDDEYLNPLGDSSDEIDSRFEEIFLSEMDGEDQAPLEYYFKSRGISAKYIYPCDGEGRVIGNRIPSQAR